MNKIVGSFLAATAAFSAGLVTGLLISPRTGAENRKWISEQTDEARAWMEAKGHEFIEESEKRIQSISKNLKETIPDLYAATETIHFEEEELEESE